MNTEIPPHSETNPIEKPVIVLESSNLAWRESEAQRMVEGRDSEGMGKYVIFCDIDNTYAFPDNKQGAPYTQEIADQAEISQIPIVFITGNDIGHVDENGEYTAVLRRVERGELPPAQIIIGAAGTEIAVLHRGDDGKLTYIHDEQFDAVLAQQSYDRLELANQGAQFINQLNLQEQHLDITQQSRLQFQHPEKEESFTNGQSGPDQPYKLSFNFFANSEQERQLFEERVRQQFSGQKILTCEEIGHNGKMIEGDTNKKYCLDIVAMTKSDSADYVIEKLGLQGGVFAGDSGNDDHLYKNLNPDFARILVGGAREEAKAIINAMSVDRKTGQAMGEQTDVTAFRTIHIPGLDAPTLAYKEPGQDNGQSERTGPESLLYSLEVLQRWESRARLAQPEHIQHAPES